VGVDELAAALDAHDAYLRSSGLLEQRRRSRVARRTRAVVERALRQWAWDATRAAAIIEERLDEVASGRRSPYDVAAEVLDQVKTGDAR